MKNKKIKTPEQISGFSNPDLDEAKGQDPVGYGGFNFKKIFSDGPNRKFKWRIDPKMKIFSAEERYEKLWDSIVRKDEGAEHSDPPPPPTLDEIFGTGDNAITIQDLEDLGFKPSASEPDDWFDEYKGDRNIQLYYDCLVKNEECPEAIGISIYFGTQYNKGVSGRHFKGSAIFTGWFENKNALEQKIKELQLDIYIGKPNIKVPKHITNVEDKVYYDNTKDKKRPT